MFLPAIERPRLSADADRELGMRPDENVFLFVGQLVLEDVRRLIEAMDHLRRLGLRTVCSSSGAATLHRQELENLVRHAN